MIDELELVEANPSYAGVRISDWRESSVSSSDLAPLPESPVGLVDTPPGGVFDHVRWTVYRHHGLRLGCGWQLTWRRLIALQRLPDMCLCAGLLEFVDPRTDMGTVWFSCATCSIFFVGVNVAHF